MTKKEKIEYHIKGLLEAIGENPDRPGLSETPKRAAEMYEEIFEGIKYTNSEIAEMFNKCFTEETVNDMVIVSNIPCFSYCEHHLALMYNMYISVGYLPKGKVIGLSKIARIADMVCRRLQLQERIGRDIAEILSSILENDDIIVYIEAEHACIASRGIKKAGTKTKTCCAMGIFNSDEKIKQEFISMIK